MWPKAPRFMLGFVCFCVCCPILWHCMVYVLCADRAHLLDIHISRHLAHGQFNKRFHHCIIKTIDTINPVLQKEKDWDKWAHVKFVFKLFILKAPVLDHRFGWCFVLIIHNLPTETLRKALSILKGQESKLYVAQWIMLVFSLYLLL